MQLVAYGAQDIYLTGNPQITFFKVVYRRHTNFSMESIQQTWAGTFTAQGVGRCTATISRNGDLVNRLYIEFNSTAFISSENNNDGIFGDNEINNGPAQWINTVECEIGGQTIDRQTGAWMEAWAELTEPAVGLVGIGTAEESKFCRMSAMGGTDIAEAVGGAGEDAADSAVNCGNIYVPLRFWFCENPGLALPLIALQYHEVKIIVDAKAPYATAESTKISNGDPQLWADYIYLDTDERRRFAQVSHEYLITQIQYQDFSPTTGANQTCTLTFNHPVKELVWTGKFDASASATDRGTTNGLFPALTDGKYQLKLNGHDRFAERTRNYFTRQQVWQYHSGPGGLNSTNPDTGLGDNPSLGKGDTIAVYSFALKPEEHQPSGTCNFSRIDNAQLLLTGSIANDYSGINTVYAVNYNVLRIMSGMGGLAYSN